MTSRPLTFHWSLSQAGDNLRRTRAHDKLSGVPPYEAQLALCRAAERGGIDSVLMAIGYTRPDPTMLTVAFGLETTALCFMVACRPGLIEPLAFVRQVDTVARVLGGRIHINIVCGHSKGELGFYGDFLDHDQRYERAGEFLEICTALWRNGAVNFHGKHYQLEAHIPPESRRSAPVIYLGGSSQQAAGLVIDHADCLWRFPDTPDKLATEIAPVIAAEKRVGLLVSLIARETRERAHAAAEALIARFGDRERQVHQSFEQRSDSVGFRTMYREARTTEPWLTEVLWNGAVPYLGAPAIALVGSYDQIAEALLDYKAIGISEFLFMGWPERDELNRFCEHVLPRVRILETEHQTVGGVR